VEKSEKLSAMLKRRGIKHELLNAKPSSQHARPRLLAQAGRLGAVTIAPPTCRPRHRHHPWRQPEAFAWARLKMNTPRASDVPDDKWKALVREIDDKEKMTEEHETVVELGGLHILGTERHEARRIDNQLRGRGGRQGDPGSSRFLPVVAGRPDAHLRRRMGRQHPDAARHGVRPGHREPHGVAAH